MSNFVNKLRLALAAIQDERGQDLIEYALVIALIAFAAVAGMGDLANGINSAFNNIATTLTAYT